MPQAGKKHPLKECLEDNSSEPQAKRGRFDNVVLLRAARRGSRARAGSSNDSAGRRILRAGKRKKPVNEEHEATTTPEMTSPVIHEADENDIINELTKEFKKARLRPVFFTISSFIEQTVDEVGITVADEPVVEFTFRLRYNKSTNNEPDSTANSVSVSDEVSSVTAFHSL